MTAYLISQVEVLDPEAWENYRTRAAPAIAQFGGRYLVRGALAEVVEADWPADEPPAQTVIVAAFPSMDALRGVVRVAGVRRGVRVSCGSGQASADLRRRGRRVASARPSIASVPGERPHSIDAVVHLA
jgi:uncharacterized protein (DUF1330 family)